MKTTITYLTFTLIFLLFTSQAISQRKTNVQKLKAFSAQKSIEWKQKRAQAEAFARQNNIPIKFESADGTFFELQYIKDGIPQYYMTVNANSAATISTNKAHAGVFNLDGSGVTVHQWDVRAVRTSHQELIGRVVMGDGISTTHYHSTHVAGTMIAAGVVAAAKGMSPNANLLGHSTGTTMRRKWLQRLL